jgi:DNA-directed RNA polymerase specialized sigma24 family protein
MTETRGLLTVCAHEMHSPDARRREEAARQIWAHFAGRLEAMVRRRLDPRILRRAGADDVVQSLFASFFAAAPGPAGPPRNHEELWRLLVRFTMCKVANTAERHRARRRDVRRERPRAGPTPAAEDSGSGWAELADRHRIDPEVEAIASEEFARLLALLPEDLQRVFALRLEGYTNAEIAAQLGRVERTVELKMRVIRGLLQPHLGIAPSAGADAGAPPGP